eukprot:6206432-Pleurochrysis_carterae.AAC.1
MHAPAHARLRNHAHASTRARARLDAAGLSTPPSRAHNHVRECHARSRDTNTQTEWRTTRRMRPMYDLRVLWGESHKHGTAHRAALAQRSAEAVHTFDVVNSSGSRSRVSSRSSFCAFCLAASRLLAACVSAFAAAARR